METIRRHAVPFLVAFVVTAVAATIYVTGGTPALDPVDVGISVLFALAVVVAVLVALLLAGGVLRLLGVRNAWATLGLAFGLVAVACAVRFVTDQPWRYDDAEWDLLFLVLAAAASLPAWIACAVGLAIDGRRRRRARAVAPGMTQTEGTAQTEGATQTEGTAQAEATT